MAPIDFWQNHLPIFGAAAFFINILEDDLKNEPNVRNESALKMKATVGRYYEGSYPSQGFYTQPWFLRFAVTDRQTNLYS